MSNRPTGLALIRSRGRPAQLRLCGVFINSKVSIRRVSRHGACVSTRPVPIGVECRPNVMCLRWYLVVVT